MNYFLVFKNLNNLLFSQVNLLLEEKAYFFKWCIACKILYTFPNLHVFVLNIANFLIFVRKGCLRECGATKQLPFMLI